MAIRPAVEADLDIMVTLSGRVRADLEGHEPRFWRRHPEADRLQRDWFGFLLADASHHLLVNSGPDDSIDGFAIARAMDAPPVYEPGGRTCFVDDLAWETMADARAMLDAVQAWGVEQGCVQLVVVTAAADSERRNLLDGLGLRPVSEWWTAPIDL